MDFAAFDALWSVHFPGHPPLGYLLRGSFPDRWLRIHSLPRSKRYADTPEEMAEILRRHNIAATEVLGDGAACVLVTVDGVEPAVAGDAVGERQLRSLRPEPLVSVVVEEPEDGEEPYFTHLQAARFVWRSGALDLVLTDVANNVRWLLLVMSERTGHVFAPYDGGADLFVASERQRDRLAERYAGWLSSRPDGL
jgi:hypothetical protein